MISQSSRLVVTVLFLAANIVPASLQAGDILRGGAAVNGRKNSEARNQAGAAAAASAQTTAKDRLARTSSALASVRAMQQTARASVGSGVADGLANGGLKVLGGPNARWDGAELPTQAQAGGNVQVTVRQREEQAILHWETFNIGKNTKLQFDQSQGGENAGKWVAFNKVFDPTGKPSQILGSMSAQGQVYVINQNGIIFGGGSQVNVRTLVASSLPINDNLIDRGLLNNPDAQFLFSALPIAAGSKGTPAFTPVAPLTPDGIIGDVIIQPGAVISSTQTASGDSGRIMLVGPKVTNAGTIKATGGQTILAGGMQVGIDAHASSDPSLRGLDVYVGSVGTYGGIARNEGLIEANRGSVTITGKSVQQMGFIESSTSVALNGRVDLLANYGAAANNIYDATNPALGLPFLFSSAGEVTLGAGSVVRILPEWDSTTTIASSTLALRSQFNAQGQTVHLAGATVQAPGGEIVMRAGKWDYVPSPSAPRADFVYTGGQIYLDNESLIDVSGSTNVPVALAKNLLTLQLRGAEFADSPLQRSGLVRGVDITVDLRRKGTFAGRAWVGTPLGDASGYAALIERSIAELTANGGNVTMQAGNSVVIQKGATVDVSGGWYQNEGGMAKTTRLLSNGRVIDIWDATPDIRYDGIYDPTSVDISQKWGVVQRYSAPLPLSGWHYERPYIEGADAGKITVMAPAMAIDGTLEGQAIVGPRQVRSSSLSSSLPTFGALKLDFRAQDPTPYVGLRFPFYSPTPPKITIGEGSQSAVAAFTLDANGAPAALSGDRLAGFTISPSLFDEHGFKSLEIENSDGTFSLPAGLELVLPAYSKLTVTAAKVDLLGSIFAPGGSLSFTSGNYSPFQAVVLQSSPGATTPLPNPLRGSIFVSPETVLSTAGLSTDDRVDVPGGALRPMVPDAGSISLIGYNVNLSQGSVLDVSGGISVGELGERNFGNGGQIVVKAGQDLTFTSILGGKLNLGADLRGYSAAVGGALTIQAQVVQIGGTSPHPDALNLSPDFFNQGGFTSFSILGIGALTAVDDQFIPGLTIAANTTIEPIVSSLVPRSFAGPGGEMAYGKIVLPTGVRPPVSLTFGANGVSDSFTNFLVVRGDVLMGDGVRIVTDPGSSVSFDGDTVTVLGSVSAPGGSISVKGGTNYLTVNLSPTEARSTVFLGSQSQLSVAGTSVRIDDSYGRNRGYVLPGGSIAIEGNILAARGAVLDVSGASGVFDFTPAEAGLVSTPGVPVTSGINRPLNSLATVPVRWDSNAGSISLSGSQFLLSEATLIGRAGGPTALGGELSVTSGRFYASGSPRTTADINLIVAQNAAGLAVGAVPVGIGQALRDAGGAVVPGLGFFAVDDFKAGGFDSLSLGKNVNFRGPVSIDAAREIRVGSGGVITADAAVLLRAPYVALGQSLLPPSLAQDQQFLFTQTDGTGILSEYFFPPTFGAGSLSVEASLIDVGTLSLQNIGKANLTARGGDIRGVGTLNIAGDLVLTAAQIYPATASQFNIFAYDHGGMPGSVTIVSAGSSMPPLSAGGQLNIHASIIEQGGTLLAPFGSINLGWDGTGTAPVNKIVGTGPGALAAPTTSKLSLTAGSLTSVSGYGMLLPYGVSLDGLTWIDPSGFDITAGGLPEKRIKLGGQNLITQAGSTVDISGGGDLFAYRWVEGNGGSRDILASSTSFAIVPGYTANYAPFAPFNPSSLATGLGGDPGYVNAGLQVGDRIYLDGSNGLPAGSYTLLPARYALLPGASLVSPLTDETIGTYGLSDGSSIVTGYTYNGLSGRQGSQIRSSFEVLPSSVIAERAEYEYYFADTFLGESAKALEKTVKLPRDAGSLVFQATQSMDLAGSVRAKVAPSGIGAAIDISSAANILIRGNDTNPVPVGTLVLDSAQLAKFGAASLLIGGIRQSTSSGQSITANTSSLTVANAGAPLSASDLILVSKGLLTIANGSELTSSGAEGGGIFENYTLAGNGAFVRVSENSEATIRRTGATSVPGAQLTVGAGAKFTGAGIILDSTYGTSLDPLVVFAGDTISMRSGQISLMLDNPGVVNPTVGLVLSGAALESFEAANSRSLLSYTTIDIYGTGTFGTSGTGSIELEGGEIRGFHHGGGAVNFNADSLLLGNSQLGTASGVIAAATGSLTFDARRVSLGLNSQTIQRYASVFINAGEGIVSLGSGILSTQADLTLRTPLITGRQESTQTITAGGNLLAENPTGAIGAVEAGLGASLSLSGASVDLNTDILLPSGLLNIRALTGDARIRGSLSVEGKAIPFFDYIAYTDGGQVNITSENGNVILANTSDVSVAAATGGGDAGSLIIKASHGTVQANGGLHGRGGASGLNGTFVLDVGNLATTAALDTELNDAFFTESRTMRVRTGDVLVNGAAHAGTYNLSADQGSITVTGLIDASGTTGGTIALAAGRSLILEAGSILDASGSTFSSAGKGGGIKLEAGTQYASTGILNPASMVDIKAGSTIDLSVASQDASSAFYGNFGGTLHIRAPQNAAGTDLFVGALDGTITGASSILIEGYRLFDLTNMGGTITNAGTTNTAGGIMTAGNNVQGSIKANGEAFLGTAGSASANYTAMMDRLLLNNAGLADQLVLAPGAEIVNRTGDLTLGTTASTATSDWNLATFRFGARSAAGVLTMRAAGNLTFYNALSDGFTGGTSLWLSPLMAYNPLLPANTQTWSYRLTAGADLTAADFRQVRALSSLGADSGSLLLGKNYGQGTFGSGTTATTAAAVATRYQVIRTGSGDIDISAGRDVRLLNQFATIYTAGTRVANATSIYAPDDFVNPVVVVPLHPSQGSLGAVQQSYAASYSMAGGNVAIQAGNDIMHATRTTANVLIGDSSRQLPMNWLYRRSFIDPLTGEYGATGVDAGLQSVNDPAASTTWWVDFSNFFEGIGALGGGDVTLIAGRDVANIDALIPTNARAPKGIADASKILELGGGDLVVKAGRNIDGGVYYVERGDGILNAANSITTNSTRSPTLGILGSLSTPQIGDSQTWLPTTLFLGKGTFDVSARGDILLGPVANPFLLPQGLNNKYWYKTYFSTYGADSGVNVSSLGGNITHRLAVTLADRAAAIPTLQAWLEKEQMLTTTANSAAFYQPWLRTVETQMAPFASAVTVGAPSLTSIAFSGEMNVVGNMSLYPSPSGALTMLASGSINGLRPTGVTSQIVQGSSVTSWTSARVNLSDADPNLLPGVTNPLSYQNLVGSKTSSLLNTTRNNFLSFFDASFAETGSFAGRAGVLQTKQALHSAGLLHANDAEPVRIYAANGSVTGLTLFSAKHAQIFADEDLADIALYIQNVDEGDVSIVAAGRDIVAYQANTAARAASQAAGNALGVGQTTLAGDIQISGPGSLEVLAGRNVDLGTGSNNSDGTGVGIISVGNARNPFLPYDGASIVVGAGMGGLAQLSEGLDFEAFVENLPSGDFDTYWAEIQNSFEETDYESLSDERKSLAALKIFYLVLRDAGRSATSSLGDDGTLASESGGYDLGFEAIDLLFGKVESSGDISTRSRDIRTKSGGSISIFAPGGGLALAKSIIGNPLTPPGIVTEDGGDISIFTEQDVDIGVGRIFTLRGGSMVIWSSQGNIAAGAASKTVQSAPPTRVIIDPQSGDVQTDLAGLATGGGIGVLATVAGVEEGNVDLIAPNGVVDAGDAGIRASGTVSIAAVQVLNADNIQASQTSGVPTIAPPAAPNIGSLSSGANSSAAASSAAQQVANQSRPKANEDADAPSSFVVEVLGYGGSEEGQG